MNEQIGEIRKILEGLTSYKGIPSDDIPDIALYMDQVTTFMGKKLDIFKRQESDKILTKTMINNYTKANLTFPPTNKKYEKDHIMMLTLIYHMKQILSVNDMAKLVSPIIKFVDSPVDTGKTTEELYGLFTVMESQELRQFGKSVNDIISELSDNSELGSISDDAFLIMMVLTLIIQAEHRKNLAEKLIDTFFEKKEPEKKKDEEKPKEKSKEKAKEKAKEKGKSKPDKK